ncbi:hypothetical protein E4T81_09540 [Barnesiella sp. WM24]|uniref:hypothetical protein n=1 Tax=Barnesiella sp. WM24 TaxID=2558278 RepID=UPI0010716EA8|nr:hypothetical protein [Barnesiella sp. WM24]TFU93188.1 hypothetical protein E4T81_09540 [Barnesiella sp. WM24]
MDYPCSYAMERCGDFQCIIMDCPCRQCRGEWKLAPTLPAWTIHDALQVSLEQETLVTLIRKNIMQQV